VCTVAEGGEEVFWIKKLNFLSLQRDLIYRRFLYPDAISHLSTVRMTSVLTDLNPPILCREFEKY